MAFSFLHRIKRLTVSRFINWTGTLLCVLNLYLLFHQQLLTRILMAPWILSALNFHLLSLCEGLPSLSLVLRNDADLDDLKSKLLKPMTYAAYPLLVAHLVSLKLGTVGAILSVYSSGIILLLRRNRFGILWSWINTVTMHLLCVSAYESYWTIPAFVLPFLAVVAQNNDLAKIMDMVFASILIAVNFGVSLQFFSEYRGAGGVVVGRKALKTGRYGGRGGLLDESCEF